MKKIIVLTILSIFSLNLILIKPVFANSGETVISNIKIGPLHEGYVQISWQTNRPANSHLLFGPSPDNLPFFVGGLENKRAHSADLTGLQKGKSYYFKIIALGDNGSRAESFINYVDTKNMPASYQSLNLTIDKQQAIHNAAALFVTTQQAVNLEMRYGTDISNLDKIWRQAGSRLNHQIIVRNLHPDTRYYYKMTIRDKDGNLSEHTGDFKTINHTYHDVIKINNLMPESKGQTPFMPEKAFISFETNVIATAEIFYGLSPDKLNSRLVATAKPGDTKHQAILEKLQPNTTYYYQIRLKSDLNRKNLQSQIYSLQTAPLNNDYLGLYYHDGDLVTYKSRTYLLFNDNKFPIYDNETIKSLEVAPKTIAAQHFNYYEENGAYWGAFHDGQVVKEEKGNTVYLIDGQYKRPIANWQVFTYLNYQAQDIVIATRGQLSKYKNGSLITHSQEMTGKNKVHITYNNRLVKASHEATVYLVANGKKLPFIDQSAFIKHGFNFSQVKTISENDLNSLPVGLPII